MRTFTDLLAGPLHQTPKPSGSAWLCLPLAALCLAMLAAGAAGALKLDAHTITAWAARDVPLAASATLVCLALAIPPALSGAGRFWLLPLWLAPAAGVLGWSLLPLPPGAVTDAARATVLTLPLMVLLLSGGWARLPSGLSHAAAAAGAHPAARLRLQLHLHLAGVLRACLPVAILCLGLVGARP